MTGVALLAQFLFRVSFGLSLGMALTSARSVTSGYFRNHLYVLLGLNVLATLLAVGAPHVSPIWPPLAAATASYVGAVLWLYERPIAGKAALALVAGLTLYGAWAASQTVSAGPLTTVLRWLDPPTSGLLLGITLAAMFLGHWYLNTPTMALAPLQKLILWMGAAVVLRAVVCAVGLALDLQPIGWPGNGQALFLLLRWLAGLLGTLALTVMSWKTLQIPNTQSATGILYVAVIATFLGELLSLLLSSGLPNPV